jgi:hypothetical protein
MKIEFNCDEKFYKNETLYALLVNTDFSEVENKPIINENSDGSFFMTFIDVDKRDILLALNDEIVMKGLDNQETVNETGKMLYWLYDEIIIQSQQN